MALLEGRLQPSAVQSQAGVAGPATGQRRAGRQYSLLDSMRTRYCLLLQASLAVTAPQTARQLAAANDLLSTPPDQPQQAKRRPLQSSEAPALRKPTQQSPATIADSALQLPGLTASAKDAFASACVKLKQRTHAAHLPPALCTVPEDRVLEVQDAFVFPLQQPGDLAPVLTAPAPAASLPSRPAPASSELLGAPGQADLPHGRILRAGSLIGRQARQSELRQAQEARHQAEQTYEQAPCQAQRQAPALPQPAQQPAQRDASEEVPSQETAEQPVVQQKASECQQEVRQLQRPPLPNAAHATDPHAEEGMLRQHMQLDTRPDSSAPLIITSMLPNSCSLLDSSVSLHPNADAADATAVHPGLGTVPQLRAPKRQILRHVGAAVHASHPAAQQGQASKAIQHKPQPAVAPDRIRLLNSDAAEEAHLQPSKRARRDASSAAEDRSHQPLRAAARPESGAAVLSAEVPLHASKKAKRGRSAAYEATHGAAPLHLEPCMRWWRAGGGADTKALQQPEWEQQPSGSGVASAALPAVPHRKPLRLQIMTEVVHAPRMTVQPDFGQNDAIASAGSKQPVVSSTAAGHKRSSKGQTKKRRGSAEPVLRKAGQPDLATSHQSHQQQAEDLEDLQPLALLQHPPEKRRGQPSHCTAAPASDAPAGSCAPACADADAAAASTGRAHRHDLQTGQQHMPAPTDQLGISDTLAMPDGDWRETATRLPLPPSRITGFAVDWPAMPRSAGSSRAEAWRGSLHPKPAPILPNPPDLFARGPCLALGASLPTAPMPGQRPGHMSAVNLHASWKLSKRRMHRFVVRRSSIAEQGVFTTEYVSAAEMIMEYVGELVRRPLSDIRERSYKRTGWGLYFFAIDADFVIDATMRGNMARYINHSCNPNCVAKLADVEGRRRVFIVSKHELAPGEELTYDYCLSSEQPNKSAWGDEHEPTSPRTAAIPCNCGATNCRGHL